MNVSSHGSAVIFNSPQSVRRKNERSASAHVNLDYPSTSERKDEVHPFVFPEQYQSPSSGKRQRKHLEDMHISREQAYSDCCNCNVELRRDINKLKSQLDHLDKTMTSHMKGIMSLLEANSNSVKSKRKLGAAERYRFSIDEQANTSV